MKCANPLCEKEFEPARETQTYCSRECALAVSKDRLEARVQHPKVKPLKKLSYDKKKKLPPWMYS